MPLPIYFVGEYSGIIPQEKAQEMLDTASRHIDNLTFNRIIGRGYDNLTEFQKDILSRVCRAQAEFEYQLLLRQERINVKNVVILAIDENNRMTLQTKHRPISFKNVEVKRL